MFRRTLFGAACVTLLLIAGTVQAQERVTLVLRSGDRVTGDLVDLGAAGFELRVNGNERRLPANDVAVIDFAGNGDNLPEAELSKLSGGAQILVLRNGDIVNGSLYDIGGTHPLRLTVNTSSGQRELTSNDVARIYLSRPQTATGTTAPTIDLPAGANEIVVRATQQWTPTGLTVQAGQLVNFSATGKVNLGGDVAVPAGSTSGRRPTAAAPIPSTLGGALLGRVGNGQAFGIGNQTSISMPDSGQLFLGINDDDLGDNSGEYRVVVDVVPLPAGLRRR
jgi:hypothetical protein